MTHERDPLEAALREVPYLDDGAFTAGVMDALPRRRPAPRRAVLAVAALAAGLLGAALLGEPLLEMARTIVAGGAAVTLLAGAVAVVAGAALVQAGR